MSYSGTVQCSHCYRRGHNKSGCPDLIKAYEEYKQKFAKYKKENPDCPDYSLTNVPWDIRNKMKVTWLEVEAAATMVAKEYKSKNRQCTYCYGKGHNRRTCEHLNRHLDLLVKAQFAYNEKISKSLTAAGYGVGALIQEQGERWNWNTKANEKYSEIGVVVGFNLNYCIIDFLRAKFQFQPSVHVHMGDEIRRFMPHFNPEAKSDLFIGRAWDSSPTHTIISYSHTPVPLPAYTEQGVRNSIKEDLKTWNHTSVKAWLHRLQGIVEVPNEDR